MNASGRTQSWLTSTNSGHRLSMTADPTHPSLFVANLLRLPTDQHDE
ncbi:hypothetical protein GFPCMMHI_01148 [Ensifer adhaerens]|nr:hypothetical protein [Ensifer adhaerens]